MPKGGAKTIRRAKNSGNRRRLRLKRYAAKLAPALLHGASADVSVSRFFAMRSFRSASRNREVYSLDILAGRRPAVSRTVKMSEKERVARRAPGAIVRKAKSFVIAQ